MQSKLDPNVELLAKHSASLAASYASNAGDPWAGSPFEWILKTSSRRKGAIGEKLVANWCEDKGFEVKHSPSSDADRIIHGHRIEIKLSTLWENGGYKFQQIRDQNYDHLFCLGISPFDARAWLLPKDVLYQYVIGHMGQHTGATGADTAWLSFKADRPYEWMAPYGGRLEDVASLILDLGRGSH